MEQFIIRYDTPLHTTVAAAIKRRFSFSKLKMQARSDKWRKSEEEHLAFVPASNLEAQKEDDTSQNFKTLVIPYSYAMVLSAHTYWSTVFLSRSPVLQFTARHGETDMEVMAIEAVMAYQTQVGGHLVPYYVWLLDVGKYGIGILGNYWDEEKITMSKIVSQPKHYLGVPIPGTQEKVRRVERIPGYEGEKLYNVRPWDFFPDPRVSMQNLQSAEFCARRSDVSWSTILKGEQSGKYFNIKALKGRIRSAQEQSAEGFAGIDSPERTMQFIDDKDVGFVSLLEMYIELVPKDWELGSSEYSEKWVFTLAEPEGAGVVIGAQPYGMYHNKFPFGIIEYEMDGYSLTKRSMYDVLRPLQDTMNWLLNTHFYNVRRSINDTFFVDPSKIVMKDLLDPRPGKIVRLKPNFYGTPVTNAFAQVPVHDVTAANINDSEVVGSLMQRVTGINDSIMAMLSQGNNRRTATEVRSSNQMGINRLKTVAEYFSAMGWEPMSMRMLQETQQLFNTQDEYRIVGNLLGSEHPFVQVDPETIAGAFDFVPVDGTMPVDRMAQLNVWSQLLAQIKQVPQISSQYDFGKIFAWLAQLGGIKNINQFKVQVQPDQVVQKAAQAGNLIPQGQGPNMPTPAPNMPPPNVNVNLAEQLGNFHG